MKERRTIDDDLELYELECKAERYKDFCIAFWVFEILVVSLGIFLDWHALALLLPLAALHYCLHKLQAYHQERFYMKEDPELYQFWLNLRQAYFENEKEEKAKKKQRHD